ncbi:MAG: TonB-dependent receptor, partial [Prolixibacteraceae bacterium]|nr:TonB-dependent receptor [Prolixibacteraceae bacterium]
MNNKIRILFLFVFILNTAFAGDLVVSGFVKDSVSLEPLIGASVYIEKTQLGTTTNSYGFFSLKMPEEISKNRMVISFIGYKTGYWDISNSKQQLIFMLVPGIEIEEIEITSKRKVEETPTMSMMKLSMKEIQYLPQLFQEDLIKTIQYLPGIQGGTEGSAGMYVRGGSADQNLILLDDVPLYYVNHAGNMISVFDNNTIKDFELYKGAFPARYGGRLSSVLDIRMKEGDKSRFHGEVGLGLLSGNAFIEGPIIKNKASFFFSYRKFWPEYMLNLITSNMNTKFSYGFYDLSAKVSADLTEKDKLMISFYHGGDELEIKKTPDEKNYGINTTRWSNLMGAIKYTRAFGKNIFSNLTFYSTQYNYFTGSEYNFKEGGDTVYNKLYINYSSNVQDISGKLEVDYIPAPGLKFKFGGQFISHWYLPGSSEYNSLDEITPTDTIDFTTIKALEPSFFIEAVYSPVHNFEINLGLRNSYFLVEEETYPSVEPRIMFRYNIPNLFAIKASYAEMVQTIHLLNYSGAGMASDLWLPPTSQLKPGHSQQVAFGLYKTICNDMYEISIEGYYKYLENMIAYKDGASFFSGTDNWQSKLETGGTGTSKGIEFYLQKNKGRFTGWLSYTLSK